MSHDSGFRRSDRNSTQRPATRRQKGSKASRAYEERLGRRHAQQEQARKQTADEAEAE